MKTSKKLADNIDDLFALHVLTESREPIDVKKVFGENPEQTVAFEVALAALISSMIVSASVSSQVLEIVATVAAIVLLLITVLRKMLIDNVLVDDDLRMHQTTTWMQFLILFALTYIAVSIAENMTLYLPDEVILITGFVLVVSFAIIGVSYELIIGDFFLWGSVKIYNKAVDDRRSKFNRGLLEIAANILQLSPGKLSKNHAELVKIRQYSQEKFEQEAKGTTLSFLLFSIFILIFLGGVLALPLFIIQHTLLFAVILSSYLVVTALFLHGYLQFILSRYGNASFEHVTGFRNNLIAILVVLGVAITYELDQSGFQPWLG